MPAEPSAGRLTPESFGTFASKIHMAFEALFGVPFEQAGRLRALLLNPPRFQSEAEGEATKLVRHAYHLKGEIDALLASGRLRNDEWRYLRRLSTDLLARVCFEHAESDGFVAPPCELPGFALRTEPETQYLARERRRIVLLLAHGFPELWRKLPSKAHPKSGTASADADTAAAQPRAAKPKKFLGRADDNAPNRLLRGIAAALILGGWISEDRTRAQGTADSRFRTVVTLVAGDLRLLAKDRFPVEGEEEHRPGPLLPPLPGETAPRRGVISASSHVLRLPDLQPSLAVLRVDRDGTPWGFGTQATRDCANAVDLRQHEQSAAPGHRGQRERKPRRPR